MRTKKIIVDIICLLLVLNFFYEGIYKIAYFHGYGFWLHHMPFLKGVSVGLNYLVPVGELVLSLLFLANRYRMVALYMTIIFSLLFILYVMSGFLFTDRLFWPYHALWAHPTWMQKMLIALGWSWLALAAIILTKGNIYFKRFSYKTLRDTPVNAS
jgi:hypothetical protein